MSKDLKALMTGLITDSSKRLTFEDIKVHPWFDKVRWDRLRSLKAPWTPRLNDNTGKISHVFKNGNL